MFQRHRSIRHRTVGGLTSLNDVEELHKFATYPAESGGNPPCSEFVEPTEVSRLRRPLPSACDLSAAHQPWRRPCGVVVARCERAYRPPRPRSAALAAPRALRGVAGQRHRRNRGRRVEAATDVAGRSEHPRCTGVVAGHKGRHRLPPGGRDRGVDRLCGGYRTRLALTIPPTVQGDWAINLDQCVVCPGNRNSSRTDRRPAFTRWSRPASIR